MHLFVVNMKQESIVESQGNGNSFLQAPFSRID